MTNLIEVLNAYKAGLGEQPRHTTESYRNIALARLLESENERQAFHWGSLMMKAEHEGRCFKIRRYRRLFGSALVKLVGGERIS